MSPGEERSTTCVPSALAGRRRRLHQRPVTFLQSVGVLASLCCHGVQRVTALRSVHYAGPTRLSHPPGIAPCRGSKSNVLSGVPTDAVPRLQRPLLELITPDGCLSSSSTKDLVSTVEQALAGGVSIVQLRDTASSTEHKARFAEDLRAVTAGKALFVINGDIEEARSCGADGVHLPERMMDLLEGLRAKDGWPRVVGCSVHSVERAVAAAKLGADYLQVRKSSPHPSTERSRPCFVSHNEVLEIISSEID